MDKDSLMKQALLEIKRLKNEKEAPIAIIGMDCIFPGGINGTDDFWNSLMKGKDCISEIPESRWNLLEYYDENRTKPGKMYVKEGGFIDNPDAFDIDLFQMTEREARYLDPQQRLFLELVWRCLEKSGIPIHNLKGTKTGVYLGISTHDYAMHSIYSGKPEATDIYSFTGSAFSMASGRLSYMLGLKGPSISIDTACSSSLVCIHEACQGLRLGDCNLAIAGGVNMMLTPEHTIQFCKVNALSPASRCKVFDARADGYVRSEGCGVIILKRLDDAIRDKNRILALIKGTAINNDGVSSSLTAPNGISQQEVISSALNKAKLDASEIDYVEAHGTGTPLGDPIEIQAINKVYGAGRNKPLYVGSVKSNLGHLEAAAGMAAVIKTILMLQHKMIVPNLHFKVPNPEFDWKNSCITVPTSVNQWEALHRNAGVSAFGFGGTNAHIILGEGPEEKPVSFNTKCCNVLKLSGQNKEALSQLCKDVARYIRMNKIFNLEKVAYTFNILRSDLKVRKGFMYDDVEMLLNQLESFACQEDSPEEHQKICYYFTEANDLSPEALIEMHSDIRPFQLELDGMLIERGYSDVYDLIANGRKEEIQLIMNASLARALIGFGVEPDSLTAEGAGWITAGYIAGMYSMMDAFRLIDAYNLYGYHSEFEEIYSQLTLQNQSYRLIYYGNTENILKVMETVVDKQNMEQCIIYRFGNDAETLKEDNSIHSRKKFFEAVLRHYERGNTIHWDIMYHERAYYPTEVPVTPFIHKSYWIERPTVLENSLKRYTELMFYQTHIPIYGDNKSCYLFQICPGQYPFLLDHGFLGKIVLPATAYLEMMNQVGAILFGKYKYSICNISYQNAMTLSKEQELDVHVYAGKIDESTYSLTIAAQQQSDDWTVYVTAELAKTVDETIEDKVLAYEKGYGENLWTKEYYLRLNEYGYLFGHLHQGICDLTVSEQKAWAKVVIPKELKNEMNRTIAHPALMDACSQVFLSFILPELSAEDIFITVSTHKVVLFQDIEEELYVIAEKTGASELGIAGNIFIYNKDYQKVAAIFEYRTKQVKKNSLLNSSKMNSLFHIEWEEKDSNYKNDYDNKLILVWEGEQSFCKEFCTNLEKQGAQLIRIKQGTSFYQTGNHQFVMNPEKDIDQIKKALENDKALITKSFYLWNLDIVFSPLCDVIQENIKQVIHPMLLLQKEIYLNGFIENAFVVVTTACAQVTTFDYWVNPFASVLRGFQKIARLEYPNLIYKIIDVTDLSNPGLSMVMQEISSTDDSVFVALRDGKRYIPKLVKYHREPEEKEVSIRNESLCQKDKGIIESLVYEEVSRVEIGDWDVEINIAFAGMNFHDVIHALDLMESPTKYFGLDCSGVVTRVGNKVNDIHVGDYVTAFAPGCIGDYVVTNQRFVMKKPDHMNLLEAATIPSAYLTAYAILQKMRLKEGSKILVHAASGGLGMAFIQLAKQMKLEVFATASKPKQYILKQMGIKYIFDSRTLDYAEKILNITDNNGVDAVINSFTGDYVMKNFEVLSKDGFFVELGERLRLDEMQAAGIRSDVKYIDFSLFHMIYNNPNDIRQMFSELYQMFQSEKIKALPYLVYSRDKVKDAFRLMQKGKHISKILIQMNGKWKGEAKAKGTIVITGGAGGIGFEIIKNLIEKGEYYIAVIGRSKQSKSILEKFLSIGEKASRIHYFCADAGKYLELEKVFEEVQSTMPPICGVIHSSGISSDNLIANETWDNMNNVLNSKAYAAWNLHRLTKHMDIKFFVMLSSVTAVIGSIGVLSYGISNSFLIGLEQYRKQLGLPCLCLNWGPWEETGMLKNLKNSAQKIWTQNGFETVKNKEGLEIIDALMNQNGNVSIMPINWKRWLKQYGGGNIPDMLENICLEKEVNKSSNDKSPKEKDSEKEVWDVDDVYNILVQILQKVLQKQLSEDVLDTLSFHDIGIDSLMSVEFRNLLGESFHHNFSVSLLFSYTDIKSLHQYICNDILHITDHQYKSNHMEEQCTTEMKNIDSVTDVTDDDKGTQLRKALDDKIHTYLNIL